METERRLEGDTLLRVRPKDSLFVGDKVRHDPPKPSQDTHQRKHASK